MSATEPHGHDHDHHHDHAHGVARDADKRYLTIALVLLLGFMAVEVVVGILAKSLALISDADQCAGDALRAGRVGTGAVDEQGGHARRGAAKGSAMVAQIGIGNRESGWRWTSTALSLLPSQRRASSGFSGNLRSRFDANQHRQSAASREAGRPLPVDLQFDSKPFLKIVSSGCASSQFAGWLDWNSASVAHSG